MVLWFINVSSCKRKSDALAEFLKRAVHGAIQLIQARMTGFRKFCVVGHRRERSRYQRGADAVHEFQEQDTNAVAFRRQAITLCAGHFLNQSFHPQLSQVVTQLREFVCLRCVPQCLGGGGMQVARAEFTPGYQRGERDRW